MQVTQYDLVVIATQIVLFLGLWLVLKRFWFDPVTAVLRERAARSEGAVQQAEAVQQEVERLRTEHAKALDDARREAQQEMQEILRHADAQQKRIVEEAMSDAERTLGEARERIAAEVAEARSSLSDEAAAIAKRVVESVMGRAV